MKDARHLDYWVSQPVDVYLVIRDAGETIRWMNLTRYLKKRREQGEPPDRLRGREARLRGGVASAR